MEAFMMDQNQADMFDSGIIAALSEEMDMDPEAMVDEGYEAESYVDVDVDVDFMGEEECTVEVDMVSVEDDDGAMVDDVRNVEPSFDPHDHQDEYHERSDEAMLEEVDMTAEYHSGKVVPGADDLESIEPAGSAGEAEPAIDTTSAVETHDEPVDVPGSRSAINDSQTGARGADEYTEASQNVEQETTPEQVDTNTVSEVSQEAAGEGSFSDQSSTTMKNEPLVERAEDAKHDTPAEGSVHGELSVPSTADVGEYNYPPPVIVKYEESQVSLFCPPTIWSEDQTFALYQDVPKDYFLEHVEACDNNLNELFGQLRAVLGESVGPDDELTMHIGKLGMTIGEQNVACCSTSLRQVLDAYSGLCRRDELDIAPPLEMDLYPQPSFSGFLNRMRTMLEEGKGFGDYVQQFHSEYPDFECPDSVAEEEDTSCQVPEEDVRTEAEHPDVHGVDQSSHEQTHAADQQDSGSKEHKELEVPASKASATVEPILVSETPAVQETTEAEISVRVELSTTADDDLIEDEEGEYPGQENDVLTNVPEHGNVITEDNTDVDKHHHGDDHDRPATDTLSTHDVGPTEEQPSAIPVFEGTDEDSEAGECQQAKNYHEADIEINSGNGHPYAENYDEGRNEIYIHQDPAYQDEVEEGLENQDDPVNEGSEKFQDVEDEVHDVALEGDDGPEIQASNTPLKIDLQISDPLVNHTHDTADPALFDFLDDDDELLEEDDVESPDTEVQKPGVPGHTTPQKRSREIDQLEDDQSNGDDQLSKRPRAD